ncbi:Endonuclease/exonuclease/phosphatase [Epithele typhae]|uniref:Endonuclease/exonuclease/phosphatase n=1 Tax=Epithele typhae TaxID=378194 RepID=UPI00200765B8|nr:Endonuclease/exonuclease/phosphatase [Epithele typhae]KAH9924633.1 Endonuclease/exonuclease/phosphatase [Epithele typhae]
MHTCSNSLQRTLSAFNRSTRRWVSIPSQHAQSQVTQPSSPPASNTGPLCAPQRLSLVSWNMDAFPSRPIARAGHILGHILAEPPSPDIVFLQEVTRGARAALLSDARIRSTFLVTDAQDEASFQAVPFATMTLLSRARFAWNKDSHEEGDDGIGGAEKNLRLGNVSRMALPSKYRRDALCVDILAPSEPNTVLRLINVHLDSLWDALPYRVQQLEILANVLREPGCGGGIVAGDFNAIRREDDGLVEQNGLVDAWVALHGSASRGGATWGVRAERRDELRPGRLDKVAMMGLTAEEMEVIRPGLIEVPRPGEAPLEIPWSDHGLRCNFVV